MSQNSEDDDLTQMVILQRKRMKYVVDPYIYLYLASYQKDLDYQYLGKTIRTSLFNRRNYIVSTNGERYLWLLSSAFPLAYLSKSIMVPCIYCLIGYQYLTHKLTFE